MVVNHKEPNYSALHDEMKMEKKVLHNNYRWICFGQNEWWFHYILFSLSLSFEHFRTIIHGITHQIKARDRKKNQQQ